MIILIALGAMCRNSVAESRTHQEIQERDIPAILEMLSLQLRTNAEKLRTWKGTWHVEDIHRDTGESAAKIVETLGLNQAAAKGLLERTSLCDVEFAIDVRENLLYSAIKSRRPTRIKAKESGKVIFEEQNTFHQRSIVTPEHYLHFQPNIFVGESRVSNGLGPTGPAAFRDPTDKSRRQQWGMIVDPRNLFSYSDSLWEDLSRAARYYREHGSLEAGGVNLRVTRLEEGSDVKYVLTLPGSSGGGGIIVKEVTLSRKAGYNPINVSVKTGAGLLKHNMTWEWQKHGDIYLPVEVRRVRSSESGTFERHLTMTETEINIPIDSEIFTYKGLDLKDGERLIDNIEHAVYVMRNGNKVPLSETSSFPQIQRELDLSVEKMVSGESDVIVSPEGEDDNAAIQKIPVSMEKSQGVTIEGKLGLVPVGGRGLLLMATIFGVIGVAVIVFVLTRRKILHIKRFST